MIIFVNYITAICGRTMSKVGSISQHTIEAAEHELKDPNDQDKIRIICVNPLMREFYGTSYCFAIVLGRTL